ncbi:hypothetical protein LSS_18643 [Leptospira santarosai serovar Shermani str. LT 821]|uniref:Uncharacterized protein n=1 Tax=Leptospira santarosai serovar Shermani str. LT 821 TaxID=758847 RepID=K8XUX9_9LEPT|nr:hypothetical protein LSS_18643 [Leptospira santarosai serovar Shermani str. LT 821]
MEKFLISYAARPVHNVFSTSLKTQIPYIQEI